jgi:hypothetical protein
VSMDTSKQQTLPRIPLHYVSGRLDKNWDIRKSVTSIRKSEGSRKVTRNHVRTMEHRLEEKTAIGQSEKSES